MASLFQGLRASTALSPSNCFDSSNSRRIALAAALTDMIGEPAKKLHTARRRNDQVLIDFRLWCRDAIDTIVESIKCLHVALVKLALKNEVLIVPGYTHLQRAQPVLLQHLLLAYVEQLKRDTSRLLDYRVRLNDSPLGACALAGTGLPIDRFMTASSLEFSAPMRNGYFLKHSAVPKFGLV